jgi:hypothetical protein
MSRSKIPVGALSALLLLSGCATVAAPPMLVQPALSTASTDLPFHGNKVLIISPKLIYQDTYTEKDLPPGYQKPQFSSSLLDMMGTADQESPRAITALMAARAHQTTLQNGFETYSFQEFSSTRSPEAQESLSELEKGSENLLKIWSKDREYLLGQLRILKEIADIDGIVVQIVNVKLGETARWDSASTGRVSAGTSSSALKVGLVETATGELVWERESFYRDLPNASNLDAMLKMLFRDFPRKVEQTKSPVEVKREF